MAEEDYMSPENSIEPMRSIINTKSIEEYKGWSGKEGEDFWQNAPFSLVQEKLVFGDPDMKAEDYQFAYQRRNKLVEEAETSGLARAMRDEVAREVSRHSHVFGAIGSLEDSNNARNAEQIARNTLILNDKSNYSDQKNSNYHGMYGWARQSAGIEFTFNSLREMRQQAGGSFPTEVQEEVYRRVQEQYTRVHFFDTNLNPDDFLRTSDLGAYDDTVKVEDGPIPHSQSSGGSGGRRTPPPGSPPPPPSEPSGWNMDDYIKRQEEMFERVFSKFGGSGMDPEAVKKMFEAMMGGRYGGEEQTPIPETAQGQLNKYRKILDRIEGSNRDAQDYAISQQVAQMEAEILHPLVKDEVKREVRTRLALHDASELIRQANGWIEPPPNVGARLSIGAAFGEAVRRGHGLDDNLISLLLKEDWRNNVGSEGIAPMQGYDVATAWNLLQNANFRYRAMVEKVNDNRILKGDPPIEEAGFVMYDADPDLGRVATNYYNDSYSVRKQAVRNYMVEVLEQDEKVFDRKSAEKSLQLAEKLSIATLETSVFNRSSATGNDQLAECMGLLVWRKSRASAGRSRGPKIHEEAITGFGTSWIRHLREKGDPNFLEMTIGANDVNPRKADKVSWEYYGTVFVNRYWEMKKLLMDRGPKPGSISRSMLQGAVAHFNTCDDRLTYTQEMIDERVKAGVLKKGEVKVGDKTKGGPQNLRVWYLAGVVDLALAEKELGWTLDDFRELRNASVVQELSPEAGTFIRESQWDWIEKSTNFANRVGMLEYRRWVKSLGPNPRR